MHDDDDGHMAAWDDDSGGYYIRDVYGRVIGVLAALVVMAIIFGLASLVGMILRVWWRV